MEYQQNANAPVVALQKSGIKQLVRLFDHKYEISRVKLLEKRNPRSL